MGTTSSAAASSTTGSTKKVIFIHQIQLKAPMRVIGAFKFKSKSLSFLTQKN